MEWKHPAFDIYKKNGTRETIAGIERVWWGGYAIRYYEPPPVDAYTEAKIAFMEEGLESFFRHAESGIRPPKNKDLKSYVVTLRAEYDSAPIEEKRVRGALLCGALYRLAVDVLETGVKQTENRKSAMNSKVLQEAETFLTKANELLKYVKRKGIPKTEPYQVDGVLDGIWGEFFQPATLTTTLFHEHRFLRLARAMKEVDNVRDKAKELVERRKVMFPEAEGYKKLIDDLSDIAKFRMETLRRDLGDKERGIPGFRDVFVRLSVVQERWNKFEAEMRESPRLKNERNGAVIDQLRMAYRLITSMAKIRATEDHAIRQKYFRDCDDIIAGKTGGARRA